jgi:PleD family two-component response regulator
MDPHDAPFEMAFRQKVWSTMALESPNSKTKILLADDDGLLRKFVSTSLLKCGYNLIIASDGQEALYEAVSFKAQFTCSCPTSKSPK